MGCAYGYEYALRLLRAGDRGIYGMGWLVGCRVVRSLRGAGMMGYVWG